MNALRKIALIRRGAADSPYLVDWLREAGATPIDVCAWRDTHVLRLGDDGGCALHLAGQPIECVDAVLMTGTPGTFEASSSSPRDRWYRNAERTAALLSALAGARRPYIVNRGDVLLWGRQFGDPLVALRHLAACGWRTPTLRTRYTTRDDDPPIGYTWAAPDPPAETIAAATGKRLAIFTREGDPFMADAPTSPAPTDVREMTVPMQALLHARGLDWVTVAIGRLDGLTHAFGMRPCLPASLGPRGFVRALETVSAAFAARGNQEAACALC